MPCTVLKLASAPAGAEPAEAHSPHSQPFHQPRIACLQGLNVWEDEFYRLFLLG